MKCEHCPWALQAERSGHNYWCFLSPFSCCYFTPRRGCPWVLKVGGGRVSFMFSCPCCSGEFKLMSYLMFLIYIGKPKNYHIYAYILINFSAVAENMDFLPEIKISKWEPTLYPSQMFLRKYFMSFVNVVPISHLWQSQNTIKFWLSSSFIFLLPPLKISTYRISATSLSDSNDSIGKYWKICAFFIKLENFVSYALDLERQKKWKILKKLMEYF